MEHKGWKGKTDGLPWMQHTLIRMMRVIDIRVFYAVMVLVIPGYLIFGYRGTRAIWRFFRLRFGQNPFRAFLSVCRSEFTVGQIVLDRFAAHAGRRFNISLEGHEAWQQLNNGEPGFLQISSHVGNFELTGYCLKAYRKRIYALVYDGETEVMMKYREKLFRANNIDMVIASQDMSHIFTLSAALRDGQIVSIPGDRVYGSPKVIPCPFLGADADFPLGPFALAVQRQSPVVAIYTMRESTWHYRTIVHPLSYAPGLSSRQQAEHLARQFAASLESVVRRYPLQWLNYYEFWHN
jgi:predicted LPLAT superfamily acyltransferase